MPAPPKARRLIVLPEAGEPGSDGGGLPRARAERESCPSCFGTGMEVVAGKGARRCPCRTPDAQTQLLGMA
jgi:hypothetical protein